MQMVARKSSAGSMSRHTHTSNSDVPAAAVVEMCHVVSALYKCAN
jgi:hypothetical protein